MFLTTDYADVTDGLLIRAEERASSAHVPTINNFMTSPLAS